MGVTMLIKMLDASVMGQAPIVSMRRQKLVHRYIERALLFKIHRVPCLGDLDEPRAGNQGGDLAAELDRDKRVVTAVKHQRGNAHAR